MVMGVHDKPIIMVQPNYDEDKGACTFFVNGLCQLHELGLKPTEGKLSHHNDQPVRNKNKILAWVVAKTWLENE
jgi:hypothetical protein